MTPREFDRLVSRYFDDAIAPGEAARLDLALREDAALARRFLDLSHVHGGLRELGRAAAAPAIAPRPDSRSVDVPPARLASRALAARRLAGAAAAVILTAAAVLFWRPGPDSSGAAAMDAVARQLADLKDFTASFAKTYRYAAPRPGGYLTAEARGTILCALKPETRVRSTETWSYADANLAPVPDLASSREWGRTGDVEWDRLAMGSSTTFSSRQADLPREAFAFCDGESMLPPTPRRSAYELARLLEGFRGDGRLRWFGKAWTEDRIDAPAGGGKRLAFRAASGRETWGLGIELDASGRLAAVSLDQTLTDSNDREIGSLASRYAITAVNSGLDPALFEPPRE
jgi:hypothetical protein